jgi:hypothetical protein
MACERGEHLYEWNPGWGIDFTETERVLFARFDCCLWCRQCRKHIQLVPGASYLLEPQPHSLPQLVRSTPVEEGKEKLI